MRTPRHLRLPDAAPDPGWRLAICFASPQDTDPPDHDPVGIAFAGGLFDATAPPIELLHSFRWQDPWVAIIDRSPSELPSDDELAVALGELHAAFRVDEAVSFGTGSDEAPASRWWDPALSAAIRGYPSAGQALGQMTGPCDAKGRIGCDVGGVAQVRGMIGWSLRLSRHAGWPQFHSSTWETIGGDGTRARLTYRQGVIVGASGAGSPEDSARTVLSAASGQLWWHRDPQDENVGAWHFGDIVAPTPSVRTDALQFRIQIRNFLTEYMKTRDWFLEEGIEEYEQHVGEWDDRNERAFVFSSAVFHATRPGSLHFLFKCIDRLDPKSETVQGWARECVDAVKTALPEPFGELEELHVLCLNYNGWLKAL